MTLPSGVRKALDQQVVVGGSRQAFPFVTIDENGFPHVALLSTNELREVDGRLLAVVRGASTTRNLTQDRKVTLVVVEGTSCHSVKLAVRTTIERTVRLVPSST